MQKKTNRLSSLQLPCIGTLLISVWISLLGGTVAAQNHDEKPLELSGFSLSQAYEITDGNPLELTDSNLNKLLYRVQKTSDKKSEPRPVSLHREVTWQQLKDRSGRLSNVGFSASWLREGDFIFANAGGGSR